jgi:hypothetical protein
MTAALLVGCSVDVPLEGKRCDADRSCPEDLTCNAEGICVASLEGVFAADWTGAMAALYRFDDDALGRDATSAGRDLDVVGAPSRRSDDAPQGAGYARFGPGDRFEIVDGTFASGPNLSFTVGGWFRAASLDNGDVRLVWRRTNDEEGYAVTLDGSEARIACLAGPTAHASPPGSVEAGTWYHSVCRMEAFLEWVTNVHQGVGPDDDQGTKVSSSAVGDAGADAPFTLSSDVDGFVGDMDEIFFVNSDLSTSSIRRIYACGVDGLRCRCDPADTSTYLDCGPVAVCGTDLPPCDQAAPTTRTEQQMP